MTEHQASRTLLKSGPELWAECSDAQSLARHLDDTFGEIRIIRLEPEQAVAWEGERVSGTVRLEPSGWGTKVTLTALAGASSLPAPVVDAPDVVDVVEVVEESPPAPPAPVMFEPAPDQRITFLGRLRQLFGGGSAAPEAVTLPEPAPPSEPAAPPEPESVAVAPPEPESVAVAPPEPERREPKPLDAEAAALDKALESLGKAHHRPFSRA
jgi:hypothetical protein